MPATTPLRHPKECRRRKCNNGEIPHATLRKSICIFEEKVLAKNILLQIRLQSINVGGDGRDLDCEFFLCGLLFCNLCCKICNHSFGLILATFSSRHRTQTSFQNYNRLNQVLCRYENNIEVSFSSISQNYILLQTLSCLHHYTLSCLHHYTVQ